MKRAFSLVGLIIICLGFIFNYGIQAQNGDLNNEELKNSAPKVFIDCNHCDRDYFREHITYVNFVRDRKDADIHILITEQSTGSGGREYTFAFIGLKDCADIKHTLVHASRPTDTRDEVRKPQLEVLERGLFPYLVENPLASYIYLDFRQRLKPTAVKDPWKFWVFSVSIDGRFSAEQSRSSQSFDLNISANKVTPEFKIRMGLSGDFDERKYEYDDETIISNSDEKNFSGMAVKSLTDHWSVGGYVEAASSTYSNLDSRFTVAPAIEFNYFPYSESTRRQLRFLYKLGWNSINYIEETIYNKTSETLINQSLTAALEVREPWGTISTSVEGSNYFNDLTKYRIQVMGMIDIRIFKGLSLDIWGRYGRIRDQLSLPIGEATLDEVLLTRKELATNYDYSFSVGLRYTFGSVFSNVVNPRFGGTRRRGRWR